MHARVGFYVAALALFTMASLASGCGGCECTATGAVGAGTADLSLAKSVSNAVPNVGDTITFTVTLTNLGPDTATDVLVQDFLPSGLTFVSAVTSQGIYFPATGVWTLGSVAVGTPQTLITQATVVGSGPQTNMVMIASADQFDPDTANNAASATESPQADLALTKTVSDPTPNVGDAITFTVALTNNGPIVATNVEVQDLLPAGLSFIAATPSLGSYLPATGVWTVGTMAVGATQTLLLQATVVSPAPLTNTATISSVDQFDSNTADNTASATETPQQADLSLNKIVSNATPNVGDTITFTVTLTNGGPDTATGVQVTDLLPAGVTFVSATSTQGSYNDVTGLWIVGSVFVGTPQTLSINALVVSPTAQTNTATVTAADQFDPNTANNTAGATETPP